MTEAPIPVFDAKRQYESIREEIDAAVRGALESGWYILGEQLAAFEREFGAFLADAHCAGVGNGTDAIRLALEALDVPRGAEVITAANTAIPTAMAIVDGGFRLRLADVETKTWNLDPCAFENAITANTAAAVPVHLYGRAPFMNAILETARARGVKIVEDCAQAHGGTYFDAMAGTLGDAGAFSFYPTKNLGAYGDGGLVASRDAAVIERVKLLRHYGQKTRYEASAIGINSRLDEVQAAILRVKLTHLAAWTERRRAIAKIYKAAFAGLPLERPGCPPGGNCVYHLFVVAVEDRDAFIAHLGARGIGTQIHYPIPIHLQPAFRDLGYSRGDFPVSERLAGRVVSIPLFPEMTDGEVERVARAVRSYFGSGN
ncbi:MAG: DegT/DnrJ/EryC1/StrS family aminotransferase [Deltaproteobacteria bacterium]|nr:DegT/DnrJ/EryC1/StrS family aminotransferase [Deltaproteobacteria bacterium]